MTTKAVFAPGMAKEDWTILRALSERVGAVLGYDTVEALRAKMYEAAPHLAALGSVEAAPADGVADLAAGVQGDLSGEPFRSPIGDYYMTNAIARASAVMAELSALRQDVYGKAAAE